jgi:glucosamine--fructose-6-phosphate aminotransferase (isomerizing)
VTSHLEQEIFEQPVALERQLELGRADAERIAAAIRARSPQAIVLAARGSSDNAARYAQYVFAVHNRLAVALAAPAVFTLYEAPPRLSSMLVLGISQSGRSPDIVAVIEEGRRQGAFTVALTNDCNSPLAQTANACLPLYSGEERAIAATKTYTSELLALAMLSTALDGDSERWAELYGVPLAVRSTLERNTGAAAAAAHFRGIQQFLVLGRGYNFATAHEVSLKLKETAYVVAEPYSSADFRHGPSAMLDQDLPVVLVAPKGKAFADVADLVSLCRRRRAEVVAISNDAALLGQATVPLPIPEPLPEWLSPIVAVVPGQLFATALAHAKGIDPDHPRGLRKVTETR